MAFSSLEGRPSAINFEHSVELQANNPIFILFNLKYNFNNPSFIHFDHRTGSRLLTSESLWTVWTHSVTKYSAMLRYWNHISMVLLMWLLALVANAMVMLANVSPAPVSFLHSSFVKSQGLILIYFNLVVFLAMQVWRANALVYANASISPMDPTVRNACHSTMMHHGDVPHRRMCMNANVSWKRYYFIHICILLLIWGWCQWKIVSQSITSSSRSTEKSPIVHQSTRYLTFHSENSCMECIYIYIEFSMILSIRSW